MDARLPELPDKEFFSMGEASRIAQVPAHTLRYWEEKIGFLRPSRRGGGHRRYNKEDLETIFFIKDLLERRKMTLQGARKALIEKRRGKPAATSAGSETQPQGGGGALPPQTLKLLRDLKREIQALADELK